MSRTSIIIILLCLFGHAFANSNAVGRGLTKKEREIKVKAKSMAAELLGVGIVSAVSGGSITASVEARTYDKAVARLEAMLNKEASVQYWAGQRGQGGTRKLLQGPAPHDDDDIYSTEHDASTIPQRSLLEDVRESTGSSVCYFAYNTTYTLATGARSIPDSYVPAANADACCLACYKRTDCYSWSFQGGNCNMKGLNVTGVAKQGTISGKILQAYHYKPPGTPPFSALKAGTTKYAEVLKLMYRFFNAQRSGNFEVDPDVPWRKPSHLTDPIVGGWYDAGDTLKISFPLSVSISFVAWGLIDFRRAYTHSAMLDDAQDGLYWAVRYLLNCYNENQQTFIGQIGDPMIDHEFWGRPEEQTNARRVFVWNNTMPAADLLGNSAAALAAASLVYKKDAPGLSAVCLTKSKSMYLWAKASEGKYSDSFRAVKSIYPSSGYLDSLAYAGGWLYRATGDINYLNQAAVYWSRGTASADIYPGWDSLYVPTAVLMRNLARSGVSVPGLPSYNAFFTEDFFKAWTQANGYLDIVKTPKGMIYPRWNEWANLQFSTTTAMLMALDAINNTDLVQRSAEVAYARSQVDYALGSGGRSFVVGWGKSPPQKPHHAASSCPDIPAVCNAQMLWYRAANPQTVSGALVGGPSGIRRHPENPDTYTDERINWDENEPAVDYNAGLTTALAGMYQLLSPIVNLDVVGSFYIRSPTNSSYPYLRADSTSRVYLSSKARKWTHYKTSQGKSMFLFENGKWLSSNGACSKLAAYESMDSAKRLWSQVYLQGTTNPRRHFIRQACKAGGDSWVSNRLGMNQDKTQRISFEFIPVQSSVLPN